MTKIKIPIKEIARLYPKMPCYVSTAFAANQRLLLMRSGKRKVLRYWLYDLSATELESGTLPVHYDYYGIGRMNVFTEEGMKELTPDFEKRRDAPGYTVKRWVEFFMDDDNQLQHRFLDRKISIPNGYFDGRKVVLHRRKVFDRDKQSIQSLSFGPEAVSYYDDREKTGVVVFYETGERRVFLQQGRWFGQHVRMFSWSPKGSYLGFQSNEHLHLYDVRTDRLFKTKILLPFQSSSKYRWFTDDTVLVEIGNQKFYLYHIPTKRKLPFASRPKIDKQWRELLFDSNPTFFAAFDPINRLIILRDRKTTYYGIFQFSPLDRLFSLW